MNYFLSNRCKSSCCGCGMCAEICPKKCIEMRADEEGFFFPTVDVSLCVNCEKCASICPIEQRPLQINKPQPKAYAAFSCNKEYLIKSSSGGIFSEIAERFIASGGLICGVTIDDKHKVYHTIIDNPEQISLLQGSKYVQSDLYVCLPEIKRILNSGKKLLFTGTPCQVAAVKKAFDTECLYTLDVLCHGVPSQKLFDEYISYLEKKHKGKLTEIAFRDKEKNGWSITQRYKIERNGKTKTYYLDRHLSEYFSGFLRNMTQRESCYQCPYTTVERIGDITLADFWGVDKVRPELYNAEGTSLVMVNSHKGEEMRNAILESIIMNEVTIKDATFQNINFLAPPERNSARDTIYETTFSYGFYKTGKTILLPKNAYKYRILALVNELNLTGIFHRTPPKKKW